MKNLSDILYTAFAYGYSVGKLGGEKPEYTPNREIQDIKALFKELMVEVIGEKEGVSTLKGVDEFWKGRNELRQEQLSKLDEVLKRL